VLHSFGSLTGEPQWLAHEPEPIYLVLHTPTKPNGHAALLLPTFGWDDECSYRRRRAWATELASCGVMAARFDFPGRENSAGSPLDPHRAESWVTATGTVARWLRERSGCGRLTAIGIGIGGLIAYQAAADGAGIDDLVLWGVRASGRAHMRELRAYAALSTGTVQGRSSLGDALDIGGHVMSEQTAAALSEISLIHRDLPSAPQRRVLLIGRDNHGVDRKLRAHLANSGVELTELESSEYQALMSPPDLGLRATQTVAAANAWITALPTEPAGPPVGEATGPQPAATDTVTFAHGGTPIRERILTITTPDGEQLRGVLSEPIGAARTDCCLVSVNSGALRHTGPSRLFVEIARLAAASGIPAARVDLPGLGDSDGKAIRSFERTERDDRASLDVIEAIYGHLAQLGVGDRFIAAGFSLGGYLTMRATVDDPRVAAALCVNPTGFVWTDKQRKRVFRDLVAVAGPDALLADPERPGGQPAGERFGALLGAGRSEHSPSRLRRRLGPVLRAADARLRQRLARHELLWRVEHRREIFGLNRRLGELEANGASVLLLLSEGEQLLRMLEHPRTAARLSRCPMVRVERLPDEDHLLRPLWVQEMVVERFVSALLDFTASTAPNPAQPAGHGVSHVQGELVSPPPLSQEEPRKV
jgi:dienelactone hydrolase/predicted alpha/beta-hydrolase family hydrolase